MHHLATSNSYWLNDVYLPGPFYFHAAFYEWLNRQRNVPCSQLETKLSLVILFKRNAIFTLFKGRDWRYWLQYWLIFCGNDINDDMKGVAFSAVTWACSLVSRANTNKDAKKYVVTVVVIKYRIIAVYGSFGGSSFFQGEIFCLHLGLELPSMLCDTHVSPASHQYHGVADSYHGQYDMAQAYSRAIIFLNYIYFYYKVVFVVITIL